MRKFGHQSTQVVLRAANNERDTSDQLCDSFPLINRMLDFFFDLIIRLLNKRLQLVLYAYCHSSNFDGLMRTLLDFVTLPTQSPVFTSCNQFGHCLDDLFIGLLVWLVSQITHSVFFTSEFLINIVQRRTSSLVQIFFSFGAGLGHNENIHDVFEDIQVVRFCDKMMYVAEIEVLLVLVGHRRTDNIVHKIPMALLK